MRDLLTRTFARPFVRLWLAFSPHSWRRHIVANDSPHVRAPGTNPDRVLILGDGAATGRGVLTHDLGLPGYLARSLTEKTRRATDVDIVVSDSMTVDDCLAILPATDLNQYDAVLMSIGANEALDLMSARTWEAALRRLLRVAVDGAPKATRVFVLAIPEFGVNPHLPRPLAGALDYHVGILNTIIENETAAHAQTVFVPDSRDQAYELEGAHEYQKWATRIARRISANLDPARVQAASTAVADEASRLAGVQLADGRLGTDCSDPVLERITRDARRLFRTPMAGVTLVDTESMHLRTSSGIAPQSIPRPEAFCHLTIRRNAAFVVEDATLDSRYAQLPTVTGEPFIRFYAGYPIESPSGARVGALCVMDTSPRAFSPEDAAALRELAFRVQKHLFVELADDGRVSDTVRGAARSGVGAEG